MNRVREWVRKRWEVERARLAALVKVLDRVDRRTRSRLALFLLLLILLACVSVVWVYYLRTRKPLPAVLPPAPVVARAFKPHFLFSIYGVQQPIGVAVTPKGDRIYVTETGGERLVKAFDRDGELLFAFAPPESRPVERLPVYVAIAPDGRVFVSDRRHHAIHIYDAGGNYQGNFPTPDGYSPWAPLGVSFAGDELYVTEVLKHQVMVFDDGAGKLKLAFGEQGHQLGQFWFPNGVTADGQGRIYVADGNNGRLQVFDAQGRFLYQVAGISLPRGARIDAEGRLYVVDAVGQIVHTYSVAGEQLRFLFDFGDLGVGDGEFNFPNDIAADETGRLYITDRVNNRVQVWAY